MKWSEKFATGVESIDNQHKMIFKMSDDFRAALDEGYGEKVYESLLETLSFYCRSHFGFEERCMEEHRCPVAHRNKQAHAGFLDALSRFQQRYLVDGYSSSEAGRLVDTVDRWLSEHICNIDIHLKQCVRERV